MNRPLGEVRVYEAVNAVLTRVPLKSACRLAPFDLFVKVITGRFNLEVQHLHGHVRAMKKRGTCFAHVPRLDLTEPLELVEGQFQCC